MASADPPDSSPQVPPPPTLETHPAAMRGPGAPGLGFAMGGGGARAAYQVGVLRGIARRFPHLRVPFVHGVSAGAINAVHVAAHHGTFLQAIEELSQLWAHLRTQDVFQTGSFSLARNVVGWSRRLLSGGNGADEPRGLVDSSPLRAFLTEVLHAVDGEITGVGANLALGRLRALALSTASYTTGQSITWVQGREIREWERPQRRSRNATLTVEHVMASAALPLLFPAVRLRDGWYGDGGVRLSAPLSPLLHMGARRIFAVSTRYDRSTAEASRPSVHGYPPPAQVLGVLLNAIFLDLLDTDALRMERFNELLENLPPGERGGMRPIDLLVVRPSQDLGALARDFEADLPRAFRFMTRGLGTRETESPDFLSLVLFEPDYLRALMRIGEADAEARGDEIAAFLSAEADDAGTASAAERTME